MYKNLKLSFRNIYEISKLLSVKNKKLKIIYSVALSNAVVLFDLLIIYLLTSFFQPVELPFLLKEIDISEVTLFLPLVILLRFLVIYLDTMNIHNLRLDIEESLRENFLDEIFLRGNYSKAKRHLKWKPSISTDKLVDDMINFEMNKYSS